MTRQTSVQITEATDAQVEYLKAKGFGTFTDIQRIAIDRMAQQEGHTTMTTQTGFDLKTASREVQNAAAALGIKSGKWEPISADRPVDALPDDAVVAKVWNSRKSASITAGDIRYAGLYLD